MARAANMQALTDDVKREFPGVVVYGIGDAAHKRSKSGHNEDDTPGSKPELEDSDSRPEHRAIDIMIGPAFSKADADALVARLLADPRARARLFYIIWNGYIWSRSNGWKKTRYTGSDQHTNHVHASGWATDDENTAGWPAVAKEGDDMSAKAEAKIDELHETVTRWRSGMPTMVDKTKGIEPVKWRIRDEAWQKKTDATLAAVLAAAQGLDTDAILARINEVAAAETARDAELADLVRAGQSGELDAAEVLRRMGEMLTAGSPPPQG